MVMSMKGDLYSKVCRIVVEHGEAEIRIRVDGSVTFGELRRKLDLLLTAFSPEDMEVVPTDREVGEDELIQYVRNW